MIDMLLFWLTYGVWMVFTWTTIAGVLVTGVSKVLAWVTDDDYNLDNCVDWFRDLTLNNFSTGIPFAIGAAFTFAWGICSTIISLVNPSEDMESFHEVAVIVAEWTSTTMQTPLLIVLTLTGVVVLLKKGYPLFKKIKTLTDTLNGNN